MLNQAVATLHVPGPCPCPTPPQSLLLAYDRAAKERPVITKALTSFIGFAVGDRIAQGVTAGPYDPFRRAGTPPPVLP